MKKKITGVLLIIIGLAVLLFALLEWIFWNYTYYGRPVDFFIIISAIGVIIVMCGLTYLVRTPANRRETWPRTLPYS